MNRILVAACVAVGLFAGGSAAWSADSLLFVPLTPCRVIDTRVSGAGGPLVAGTPRTFVFRGPTLNYQSPAPFPNQGGSTTGCGIPDLTSDASPFQNIAKAVAINIVAVGPAGAGDLRAWAANQSVPTASVINYAAVAGLNIANGVIVPMCDQVAAPPCASGDITFRADVSGTHLVVDVVGYFHAGSTALTISNTAVGHLALQSNTTGRRNTASGTYALALNTTGYFNTATGAYALSADTTGNQNTASGAFALFSNTTGHHNTASGAYSLFSNTTGFRNAASGASALFSNTTGYYNTASGYKALSSNTTGFLNTGSGYRALSSNTTGFDNTGSGARALQANTTGYGNTATGAYALRADTTGNLNTASGAHALQNNNGSHNVGIGNDAGLFATTGNDNIFISNSGSSADSATIKIGIQGKQTTTFIAGIRGTTTVNNDAVAVLIDSAGQLGTVSSSFRLKQDIEDVGEASERILNLRPVKFRYKEQAARGDTTPQFGLIAEEVAKVFPELVVYDKQGQPETVKYHLLVPLLLGEAQKQARELADARRSIRDQEEKAAAQQKELQEERWETKDRLEAQQAEIVALREQRAALGPLLAEMEALKRRVEDLARVAKREGALDGVVSQPAPASRR